MFWWVVTWLELHRYRALSSDIRYVTCRATSLCTQAYIDRYSYEHVPICGAVDEHSNVAFSFHVDKVKFTERCSQGNLVPENCVVSEALTVVLRLQGQSIDLIENCLWQDVTPNKGHYQDQQASGHAKPSSTLGYVLSMACFDSYVHGVVAVCLLQVNSKIHGGVLL